MARAFDGGCLCGHVRFRLAHATGAAHGCSCRMCQRHTRALTAVWVEMPRDAVEWTGPGGAPALYRSSARSQRAFCPVCGSSLGAVDDAPAIALLTGSFDAPHRKALVPASHSYLGGRPGWWRPHIGGAFSSSGR